MNRNRYHRTVKSRTKLPFGKTLISYKPPMGDEVIDAAGIIAKTLAPIVIALVALFADLLGATKEDARIKEDKAKNPEKYAKIAELEAEIERLKKESH